MTLIDQKNLNGTGEKTMRKQRYQKDRLEMSADQVKAAYSKVTFHPAQAEIPTFGPSNKEPPIGHRTVSLYKFRAGSNIPRRPASIWR